MIDFAFGLITGVWITMFGVGAWTHFEGDWSALTLYVLPVLGYFGYKIVKES